MEYIRSPTTNSAQLLYNSPPTTTTNGRTTPPPIVSPTGTGADGSSQRHKAGLNNKTNNNINNNNFNTNTSSHNSTNSGSSQQHTQQLFNNSLNHSNNCLSSTSNLTASVGHLNGDIVHSGTATATPNDTTSGSSNSCNTSDDPETKPLIAVDLVSKKCQNTATPVGEPTNGVYHEYVNKTFDKPSPGDDDKKTLLSTHKESTDSTGDGDGDDEKNEDIKPLLTKFRRENERTDNGAGGKKPKSIVKSTSAQHFPSDTGASYPPGFTNQKPRLSFQHNVAPKLDVERPILRVQFEPTSDDEEGEARDCASPTGSLTSNEMPSTSSSTTSSSSSSSNGNSSYSEAKPPDGGYGWVIVFASFMINAIADGITFSFGVFYVEFLDYFGEGKAKTAWIGSLFMAMPLLSGPVASFLTDRYGCRKVTIVGSILACAGFVLSTLATSIEVLFLTFGILAGFGLSLCYVAAVVIVAYYFDKRRSFATGLSVCGSGIGTFLFAPFTQYLLDLYGWRGTTLILAGIFLNMTVCGVLMRDLEWTTHRAKLKRKNQKLARSAESFSVSNSTNTGRGSINVNQVSGEDDVFGSHHHQDGNTNTLDPDDPRLFSSLITLPTYVKNGEKIPVEVLDLLSKHRNVHEVLMQKYPSLLHSRSISESFVSQPPSTTVTSPVAVEVPGGVKDVTSPSVNKNPPALKDEMPWLRRVEGGDQHHHKIRTPTSAYLKDLRMHRHSLTYRGAMLNINRYRLRASSCPDIYRNSMTTIAKEKTDLWYQGMGEFRNLIVGILDISYFSDIRFLLFAISNFLLYTWYDVPYVYLSDNAVEMGFSETEGAHLIAIIGIVNMVAEILLGWMGDQKAISANMVYAICMGFCGVVIALIPVFTGFNVLALLAGLFGMFIAANYSLTSIILVELITLEKFTSAYGLLLLVQGIANLVGPPLAGWVYDITGTYDLSFYLAGFFVFVSGLLLFILPILGKCRKYHALQKQNSTSDEKSNNSNEISAEIPNKKKRHRLTDCFGKEKDLINEGVSV